MWHKHTKCFWGCGKLALHSFAHKVGYVHVCGPACPRMRVNFDRRLFDLPEVK